jgi:hypothetical protein
VFSYVWLLNGVFLPYDEANDTKAESVTLRRKSLKAEFYPLVSSGAWETKIRTDDANVAAAIVTGFFTSVIQATSADLGALTLTSGVGDASEKQITLTFAKAGGGTSAIANASAANITVVLDSDHSVLVPTSYTPSAAGVAPTVVLLFSGLTAAAHTIVVNSELKDSQGVSCVVKSIAVTPGA